ncbi:cache domain-containing protein, partial [Marinitoga arctica]
MKSLKTKLALVFSLIIISAGLFVGVFLYFYVGHSLEEIISESSFSILEEKTKQIENFFDGLIHQIALISNTKVFENMEFKDSIKVLKEGLKILDDFSMLFIADRNGDAYTTSNVKTNIKDREYFKEIMSGKDIVISDVLISKADASSVIVIAHSVKNEKNETVGLIGATISINKFLEFLYSDKTQDIYSYIVDLKGVIIAHTIDNFVGNNIFNLNYIGLDKIAQKMINGEKGYGNIIIDDEKRIIFYMPVKNLNWSTAISIPEKFLLKRSRNIIVFFNGIIFLATLFSLIIS